MPNRASARKTSMISRRRRDERALRSCGEDRRARGRSRARIRPVRSSAHGRRSRAIRSTSWPPGRSIAARRPVRPRRAAATSVAQAAEPQASVMPTPRSQTLSPIWLVRKNLGERDVGLLGKQRMGLVARPQFFDRRAGDIGDEENDVRVAHVDDARRPEIRRASERNVDRIDVGDLMRQRDFAPAEAVARPCRRDRLSAPAARRRSVRPGSRPRRRFAPSRAPKDRRRSGFRCRRRRRGVPSLL